MASGGTVPAGPRESDTVSATPTRDFFISMLVRDIDLDDAIVDLVDNCVDGARRTRSRGDFAGLSVRIVLSPSKFLITDNCGGIPIELARDYAFCFGRPKSAEGVPHSIGRFGVGMKRAMFKMGEKFSVDTETPTDHYQVGVDVRKWATDPGAWTFPFYRFPASPPGTEPGTKVEVSELHETVANDFGDEAWINSLREKIGSKHYGAISQGLGITVNTVPVQAAQFLVRMSDALVPAVSRFDMRFLEVETKRPQVVSVKVVAGLGISEPRNAGWYVYCNGRMVIEADTDPVTGWGAGTIPKYHNQYAEFRGYAFLETDFTDLLPWRTTKTGVDIDSPVYRRVLQEMVDLTRPIIDFLNAKKQEADSARTEEQVLDQTVEAADLVNVESLTEAQKLRVPEPDYEPLPEEAKITYWETVDRIDQVKARMGIASQRKNQELGKRTFQYYYDAEVERN